MPPCIYNTRDRMVDLTNFALAILMTPSRIAPAGGALVHTNVSRQCANRSTSQRWNSIVIYSVRLQRRATTQSDDRLQTFRQHRHLHT